MASKLLPLFLAISPALAHFGLTYPSWRADTLADDIPARFNQWTWPCAGVLSNDTGVNTTDWPLDGGSLKLELHHAWTYVFVNIGYQVIEGSTVSSFNFSLTGPNFWNVTQNGTLCVPKMELPASLRPVDGQRASLQVITPTTTGAALYNCADITFRANAATLPDSECQTSPGLTYYQVQSGPGNGTVTGSSPPSTTTVTTTVTAKAGAASTRAGMAAVLASVLGAAVFFMS